MTKKHASPSGKASKFGIGCHLSSAKGYLAMGEEAVRIGADVFQFFTRNPRGGAAKAIDPVDIAAFLDFAGRKGIGPILAHAAYTLNPASTEAKVARFAREAMADDLVRLEHTPGALYNFHPGSHVGKGTDAGVAAVAATLDEVVPPGIKSTILLETMSGKGSEVGGVFEELRAIIDTAKAGKRLGVCLDTCHVFDAGYDIVNDLDGVLERFDRHLGLERLRAIHLNDSMNGLGSRKDRHAKLGEGNIGWDAIARVINHPALRDLPFYLETPNDLDGYAAEIAKLKTLRTS